MDEPHHNEGVWVSGVLFSSLTVQGVNHDLLLIDQQVVLEQIQKRVGSLGEEAWVVETADRDWLLRVATFR